MVILRKEKNYFYHFDVRHQLSVVKEFILEQSS